MRGKGLTAETLRSLLEASYSGEDSPVGNWKRDNELSTDTAHVFYSGDRAVVAHRGTEGTASDWGNNLKYATTGEVGYKQTDRFKESKEVQKAAEEKYGADKISTIGHSQGGLLAELLGKDSKEIITVNKATSPWSDNTAGSNQYDIRSECDKVSMFRDPFKKQRKNDTVIKGKKNWAGQCKDSVKEHSYDILNRRDKVEIFGDKSLTGGRCWQGYSTVPGKKHYCPKGGSALKSAGTFVKDAGAYYWAPGNMSKVDILKRKQEYLLPCSDHTLATYNGYCPENKTCYAGFDKTQNGCQHWYDNAGKKTTSMKCTKNNNGGYDCKNVTTTAPSPPAGFKIAQGTMEGSGVSNYSKKKAESLGVDIKPSTKKGKKIDVFKDGKLVASIGAKGYKDYPTHLAESGKKVAEEKRKAYKMRHEKDRHTPGTPGFYADKILW